MCSITGRPSLVVRAVLQNDAVSCSGKIFGIIKGRYFRRCQCSLLVRRVVMRRRRPQRENSYVAICQDFARVSAQLQHM